MPKGPRFKQRQTLDKERAREVARQLITAELKPLIDAQIAHALGLKYLVIRAKKTGKVIRVTETMARTKLGNGEEIIEVWEKDPSVQAFTDLLNRALDKPKEQALDVTVVAGDELLARLAAGRAHARLTARLTTPTASIDRPALSGRP